MKIQRNCPEFDAVTFHATEEGCAAVKAFTPFGLLQNGQAEQADLDATVFTDFLLPGGQIVRVAGDAENGERDYDQDLGRAVHDGDTIYRVDSTPVTIAIVTAAEFAANWHVVA